MSRYRDLRVQRFLLTLVVVGLLLIWADPLWAGPGGEIVEAVFKTKIGRILGIIAVVILAPLIIYVVLREWLGVRRTRRDLQELSQNYAYFAWPRLESRVRKTAESLYGCWTSGDLSPAAPYLNEYYLESQQAILDRWADEGKRNVTQLKKITRIRPLSVWVEDDEHPSRVAVQITMNIVDYLEDVKSKKRLKGSKSKKSGHEVIFIMIHEGDDWRLFTIEEGDESLAFASAVNDTDTSFLERAGRGRAHLSTREPSEMSVEQNEEQATAQPTSSAQESAQEREGLRDERSDRGS